MENGSTPIENAFFAIGTGILATGKMLLLGAFAPFPRGIEAIPLGNTINPLENALFAIVNKVFSRVKKTEGVKSRQKNLDFPKKLAQFDPLFLKIHPYFCELLFVYCITLKILMMAKPTLQFKNLSEGQLALYAENILVKMTENYDLFPDPNPGLLDLESAIRLYSNALSEASFRDMRQVVLKNQKKAALKKIIYRLSLYVAEVSMGDRALVLAAGFMPSKDPSPVGLGPKPFNFRVYPMPFNSGHVRLRVNVWKSALVYQFEYRKKAEGERWEKWVSSKSSCVIADLEPLQLYEFRVAYVNRSPLLTYSDVISMHVF